MAKVLIVDDAPELLEFLSMLLKMRKYDVETADSKPQLIDKIQHFVPDLILLDVKLGGENGRDICKHLKSKTPFRHIPIILLSANPVLLEEYKECEANDVLEKPFDIAIVLEKINSHLQAA